MKTPARMTDLRHVRTGLSAFDSHEACNESAKLKEIEAQKATLGVRYLLHPANATLPFPLISLKRFSGLTGSTMLPFLLPSASLLL